MERFRQRYGIALTKKKLQEIILMLMAWEAVFAFSYLGYIELPTISTTTLHILVIVAAMMLGAQGSVPVVCVFVVTSMWIGTYSQSQLDRIFSPFASGMPLGSIMRWYLPACCLRWEPVGSLTFIFGSLAGMSIWALRGLRLPAHFFMGCAFLPRYIAAFLCCGK